MIFEILTTTSMIAISATAYLKQNGTASKDQDKIKMIADSLGLKTKEGSIRIYRKTVKKDHAEYIFKIPLGLSFHQFESHKQVFIDGLNNKSTNDLNLQNFLNIDWSNNQLKQIKNILNNRKQLDKKIDISYDGMLRFKVYDNGLDKMYLYDDATLEKIKGWQVPIGYTYDGFVVHDFDQLQMLVVAGMTRYGKTVFLKTAITSLIAKNPNHVEFTLIDLKGGLAFNRFANCEQVHKVAKNEEETLGALEGIHTNLLRQQREFLSKGYEDIEEAKYKKRHFVIIDEGAEVAGFEDLETKKRCTHLIGEIARLGAGLSYRVIFATQYPTADVFPRAVKSNTSAALCFKLKNATQSSVVLDRGGAESLPVGLRGRAIYQTDQEREVQTLYIENEYIKEIIKPHIREGLHASGQSKKSRETAGDIVKFEPIGLSDKKANTKATRSKK